MKINVKKVNPEAVIPTRGSVQAAGYDLYSDEEPHTVYAHSTEMIGTGIAVEIPEGYFGAIFARSGLGRKGLRPANCVGVVDSDYRGEVKVALHNDTDYSICIAAHERIAQLVVLPYLSVEFNVVDELNDTKRGSGGFGSTGRT